MTTERIREIQNSTAYPDSISVQQALTKVWNEVAQEYEGWKEALNFSKPEKQNKLLSIKNTVTNPNGSIDVFFNDADLLPINVMPNESPVNIEEVDDVTKIKQAFYVKAKIQSKVDLKCVFVTDHLVHLGDLPVNQIEHAVYDEIAKRIKDREEDKYEILAIEKIILALDNPPEMT